jgi:Na+/proline symporter
MIGGMYWRGGTRGGALAGLSAGFLVWGYTLLLPSFAKSGWLPGRLSDARAVRDRAACGRSSCLV